MSEKKKCLVVDDSPIIREIAVRIIADCGFATVEAENSALGVECCRDQNVDAVLLDWDLPSMGALDFLRGAAELEKKPVIVLCATENDHQQFALAKAAGAAFHVLKPFDKQAIEVAFREAGLIESDAEDIKAAVND